MAPQKHSLLITSMGSLVGQNIMELLQGRRHTFHVAGLNTESDNAVIFQSDEIWKCPPSAADAYPDFLIRIIEKLQPDFVLPGRDSDVGILSKIRDQYPEWSDMLPVGTTEAAEIMDDKFQSADFAVRHGLPFARSIDPTELSGEPLAAAILALGFPQIAKPRKGFGSQGVRYLINLDQALLLCSHSPGEYVLQELIDPPAGLTKHIERYLKELEAGIPAFFQLPDDRQYAGQCMIAPGGEIGPVCCSRSTMVIGRCERSEVIINPEMEGIVRRYAEAISDIGWRGPFNIQGRMSDRGFVAVEMNGRFSGSTSARGWMGHDEIRELYLAFRGIDIGPNPDRPTGHEGLVLRVLSDRHIRYMDIATLNQSGYWQAVSGDLSSKS